MSLKQNITLELIKIINELKQQYVDDVYLELEVERILEKYKQQLIMEFRDSINHGYCLFYEDGDCNILEEK